MYLDHAACIFEMHLHLNMFDWRRSSVGWRAFPDHAGRCGEQRHDEHSQGNAAGNDGVEEGAGTSCDGVAISTGTHSARPP